MKYTAAILVAAATAVSADCSVESFEEGGNWYCQAVNQIKYSGLETSGTYSVVSDMSTSGTCDYSSSAYSGSIAPFDQELSVHIRGPVQLRQFAAYTLKTSSSKRSTPNKSHRRRGQQAEAQEDKRAVGDVVTATINGQVVTWVNTYSGATNAAQANSGKSGTGSAATSKTQSTKTATGSSSTSTAAAGDYQRIAYYNANSQEADGVTFLGNYGGTGSGVWDATWGNSLSYLSSDGTTGASSPQVLENVLVEDNTEYSIWTATECNSTADCGYYRDGSVAYHGFDGADKIFLFDFTMPLTGKTGTNGDMPAIWLLNSKIPRTGQYSACSCWESGCGEFDLVEVLASGDTKAKSTFHYQNSLGSSDYFTRPTTNYMQVAVVFRSSDSSATIQVLSNTTDFASTLTSSSVENFLKVASGELSTLEKLTST
ncbi:putative TOS1-like glycosyl hydrolase-domain-containing protein [Xylariales sp. PMI_506]|nr:putative TOS1-like glycosyl hydrolase-domain-containing protein [Xylariales sp. PMI_506]